MGELTSYELSDGIATITMDDGKVNALSIEMLEELHAGFDRAEADAAVTVLTGREGRFCAGYDLAGFQQGAEAAVEMLRGGATLCERMLSATRPMIVASNGHAVAAGAFLLLAADARIGAEGEFKIGLNEVQIGLTMPTFVIELARYRLAPRQFDRCVVTAEMLSPGDAAGAGFLDRTVSPDGLDSAARQEAERLAALDPRAYTATKQRARAGVVAGVNAAIAQELTVEALTAQA